MIFNKWGHIIVIRPDPIVGVYFIRHVRPVNIEPILAVHEVHTLGFGVPHTLHARPSLGARGEDLFDLVFVDGLAYTIRIVS